MTLDPLAEVVKVSQQANSHIERQRAVFDALIRKSHPQRALLTPGQFATDARSRGIGVSENDLEEFEAMGVLFPVVRWRMNSTYHRVARRNDDGSVDCNPVALDAPPGDGSDVVQLCEAPFFSGRLLTEILPQRTILWSRTGQDFVPWNARGDAETGEVCTFYHETQLIRLDEIASSFTFRWRMHELPDADRWDGMRTQTEREIEASRSRLVGSHGEYLHELALLLAIEDVYLPEIRRAFSGLGEERTPEWHRWRESLDVRDAASRLDWQCDALRAYREDLACRGRALDPNEHFWMLFRSMPFSARRRLRDRALLAWDCYETAEIVGSLLRDLTGEPQPHVDDIWGGGGGWKSRAYGLAPGEIDHSTGNILPSLTRQLGLDVRPRVLWVVEGDTEEAFVRRYCELHGIDLESCLVVLRNIKGISKPKDPGLLAFLRQVRDWGAALFVTLDGGDTGASELRRTLVAQGLARPEALACCDLDGRAPVRGVLPWRDNFENSNFTVQQLFSAWLQAETERETDAQFGLLSEELELPFARHVAQHPDRTSLELVRSFAKSQHRHYSKTEVGRRLPDVLVEGHVARPGSDLAPIEKALRNVLALAAYLRIGRVGYPLERDGL